MIENFHFLRPEWLLALIPLILISWLLLRKKLFSRSWQSVIDPQLLPHLLIGKPGKQNQLPVILFIITGLLSILALAGPAWQQLPQPVFKQQSALIIALDLSQSMDAADIKPSRLSRARFKLSDILNQRKEGQTALIAYAGSAFTVTPLTDDTDTIDALIPSLTTDIMPAQGSNTAAALMKAAELFKNAGITKGDIFLITDSIEASAVDAINDIHDAGHRISVLAIGTEDGAPVALANGGFLKDSNGAIVIPKLDTRTLRNTAVQAGGRFSLISTDDSDIKHLLNQLDTRQLKSQASDTEMTADSWREEGPWLILLLIPIAALGFRRGYLVVLATLILPYPENASALDWDQLWSNDNQRASKHFQQGDHQQAAELFNDHKWKAAAYYKNGDYQKAIDELNNIDQPDAHYNRGNALARAGKLQQAIDAYNLALQQNPDHEDAKFNKSLLEQQQKDQQNQQGENKNKSDNNKQNNQQQSSDKQQASDNTNNNQESTDNTDNNAQQQNNQRDQSSQSDKQDASSDQNKQQQEQTPPSDSETEDKQLNKQSPQEAEQQELSEQASKQWLRKIPDNPGDLLRRKFKYQYNNQQQPERNTKPW